MSIKHVILGFLSEAPLTGYDLKKKFSSSEVFHWSGNSNQIYKALVELHEEKLVTVEVQYQESKPSRKLYTLTDKGRTALRQWVTSTPELPQFQHPLLMQLTWANQAEPAALSKMLSQYEENVREHLVMLREQMRRDNSNSANKRVAQHWLAFYELELEWVHTLHQELDER